MDMQKIDSQLEILKQLYLGLSEECKQQFLKAIAEKPVTACIEKNSEKMSITEFLRAHKYENGRPAICPFCGGKHVVKNGSTRGIARYLCRICGKTFGDTQDTILKNTRKSLDVWHRYIECMINKFSLRKSAEICNLSLPVAFAWRHKILDALQNMMEQVQLDGIVEADETFMAISYKGNHKQGSLPRKSHRRGTKATTRGLSCEKVCIPCGVNMGGLSIARISNLGKPSWKDIDKVLGGRVKKGSIFVTDSFKGYGRISYAMGVDHIRIKPKKHTEGSFNIQLMNNYHSQLKEMVNGRFRGVSTKYLNNYIVYHNLVNFSRGTDSFKEETMFNFTLSTRCTRRYVDISRRDAIPLL